MSIITISVDGSVQRVSVNITATPMWVGVQAGRWGPEGVSDIKACVPYVRLDCPNEKPAAWVAAGLKVIADYSGPYNTGGVKNINAQEWVANVVAFVKENPSVIAVEALNEPYGPWFWGQDAESAENAKAYANLLRLLHEAFVSNFGTNRPLILAADAGWISSWLIADPATYDGVVVHPYGGTEQRAQSALGNRTEVETIYARHKKPIYITEVGWPTAVGQPNTGDSLQWSEAEQATNITNFIAWARSVGYISAVIIFNYRDYGTNDFYGIERWENPAGTNGSKKPAYWALQHAAKE